MARNMAIAALVATLLAGAGCRRRAAPDAPGTAGAVAKPSRLKDAVGVDEAKLLRAAQTVRACRVKEGVRGGAGGPEAPTARMTRNFGHLGVTLESAGIELPGEVAQRIVAEILREDRWSAEDSVAADGPHELMHPNYAFWLEAPEGGVVVLWDSERSLVQVRIIPEDGSPRIIEPEFAGDEFAGTAEINRLLRECLPNDPSAQELTR